MKKALLAASIVLAMAAWVSPLAAAGANGPPVVLVGDTQRTGFWERLLLREQNDGPRAAVMAEIAHERPALVVILGDLVAAGGSERAWAFFDRLVAPLRADGIVTAAILGNHDYRGNPRVRAEAVSSRFPELASRTWGVVRSGAIAVVLLDSNFAKLGAAGTQEEAAWYRAELAALDRDEGVRWVVVTCHHPPFTNSTIVSPSGAVRELFVPPFLAARKAALFASGHCHSYEHFRESGRDFVVTGGGGGPRQRVDINLRQREFDDLFAGPAIRPFNFCRLEVEDGRLEVEMVGLEEASGTWSVRDRFAVASGREALTELTGGGNREHRRCRVSN